MCEPCTPDALLEAVRGLRVADPDLGFKPLLAKLRQQQPDLGAATKEVREALAALKDASEASKAANAAPPAAEEGCAPSNVALSLACIGCARLPSDMDDGRAELYQNIQFQQNLDVLHIVIQIFHFQILFPAYLNKQACLFPNNFYLK